MKGFMKSINIIRRDPEAKKEKENCYVKMGM